MKLIVAASVTVIALSWVDSFLYGGHYAPAAMQVGRQIIRSVFF